MAQQERVEAKLSLFNEEKEVSLKALMPIRQMEGGARSQLIMGTDGKLWVVKFRNNPQHLRVLANEFIAT